MMQLYFLSILCNGLCGYVLFAGKEGEPAERTQFSLNHPTFHLTLGILSIITGVLKLLLPSTDSANAVPILGDLVPAVAGGIAGIMLIFGIHRDDISQETESPASSGSVDRLAVSLLRFRKPIGLMLLLAAVVHFLFPGALFL